jgi:hypothetical protein
MIDNGSITGYRQRLVNLGGRRIKHARYCWLLLVEGHLAQRLFGTTVGRIESLPPPERIGRGGLASKQVEGRRGTERRMRNLLK